MARREIHVGYDTPTSDITVDPSAWEPLGHDVGVFWDDSTPKDVIVDAIQRAKERLAESLD